ncbi:MAG TPA: amidohydrolase family protein [Actinocrinis sp.]|nr:amidohydrolase family protein [Actinocrinis sp.]
MGDRTVLRDVRVFDGDGFGEPSSVVIDGDLIGVEPQAGPDASAAVVDGGGGYLLPGLIDCHIHLVDEGTLHKLASYGVTTALDMGTWPPSLVDSLRGVGGVTDIRSSGVGASQPTSRHAQRGRPVSGMVTGVEDADGWVADRVAEGADYIKVVIDLPGFDQPTLDALVVAAHARGKQVIMHASSFEAVRMAQSAGADVATHAPLDRAMDEQGVARMVADGRISVPTLAMMEGIAANIPGPSYEAARVSVAELYRAGVPVLAGTDANEATGVPASPPFGESLHHELELLVGAGLSTLDTLRAATILPAQYFALPDRGAIQPGWRADLVLLSGDPLADIRATRLVERVWCAGVEHEVYQPAHQ